MRTHEPELTEPVELCRPGGRRLDPAAKGWSRRPLHHTGLAGVWGRTKRWDYWAVQSEGLVVAVTLADVDYLGLATVDWIDVRTHRTGGRVVARPIAGGPTLPDTVCHGTIAHRSRHLELEFRYAPGATTLRADWTERDGTYGRLDVVVDDPPGHESLNVVIPWSDTRFQFTSKHQARPARGTFVLGDRTVALGTGALGTGGRVSGGAAARSVEWGGEAWGILDVGRGRWPYRTHWNWGGGAGRSAEGPVVGLQIGAKWTEGTGFTENGVLVDGRLHKIGDELEWTYDWDRPMEPWRVRSPAGDLDVVLHPVHDRHARTWAAVLATEVHQVFGHWTGTVPDGAGGVLHVDGILGFAEESRSRW